MPPRRTSSAGKPESGKRVVLAERAEEILKAVHFYRYMTALDVTHLLYTPTVLKYVRNRLAVLAGGADEQPNKYLYRFSLPRSKKGEPVRVYTLGSRSREVLEEAGLPVDWYFRPEKVKHLSFGHLMHQLTLTRFLVAAHAWSRKEPGFRLAKTRISYELARTPSRVMLASGRKTDTLSVVPDAWLLFEQLRDGEHAHWAPVLLEIDRGTEYQQKFKQHVRGRIEFIRSGAYREVFGERAVTIAYVTTGEKPEYRETRRQAMCAWIQEVLAEGRERWATVFRIASLVYDEIYSTPLFQEPVWYRPDQPEPVRLFAL